MRAQLSRMDGIIEDLHKVKNAIIAGVSDLPQLKLAKSNDPEGDLATTLAFTISTVTTITMLLPLI